MPQLSFSPSMLETGVVGFGKTKMGETTASNAGLEVSISFGRFENDSLSWEKWSSFSTNKYLEEVEKCATPGSVAEKKAYFEAHYKKIAARKAELMEQEKHAEAGPFKSDADNNRGDVNRGILEENYEIDASAELNFARRMEQVNFDTGMRQGMETDKDDYEIDASSGLNFARGMERVNFVTGMGQEMETNEDDLITIECHSFSAEPERVQLQDEPSKGENKHNLNKVEEECIVKSVLEQELIPIIACVAAASTESQSNIQEDAINHRENADSQMGSNAVHQEENARFNPPGDEIKTIRVSKEKNTPKTRKKPPSPLLKSPQITTPKVSKPISASATSSASRFSTRARTAQAIPRSKNLNTPSTDSSKKVAPKSLRKSFSPSLASAPASAPIATRKSFIMESMGDKDIVKRAFKMFQSNARKSDLPGDDKSSMSKQAPSSRTELRASHSIVTRKENRGAISGAAVQRGPRASPPSFGLRSNEKPRAVPQHVKKFQDKPNAKRQEETNLQLKLEEDKEAGVKPLRQGLNFKAASSPASRRQSKLKNNTGKGGF